MASPAFKTVAKQEEAETKSRKARIEVVRLAHDPERSRGAAGI
jgi:hypothetical protein